jgi:hypothetical protein
MYNRSIGSWEHEFESQFWEKFDKNLLKTIDKASRYDTINKKTMKNLGFANGWNEKPVEFVNHERNCGTVSVYKHSLGLPGTFEMRERKVFDVRISKIGPLLHRHECKKCGCNWIVDSR